MPAAMTRYVGKAWNDRFFPRLSKKQVAELRKEDALLVLPVGAVEQHGPHLPVFTDALIGEALLTQAFEQLPDDANIWLLPPLSYGKSTEHLGHPGTLSLSAETLMGVLRDLGAGIRASGFRKLVLFNTHGGNTDLLNMTARDIRSATGLAVFRLDASGLGWADALIDEREQAVGIHAGDTETSLVLAIAREWVDMTLAPCEIPRFPEAPHLAFKRKAFAWVMDDLSASGASGDATRATAEKGMAMLVAGGRAVAEALMDMAAFEMDRLRDRSQ